MIGQFILLELIICDTVKTTLLDAKEKAQNVSGSKANLAETTVFSHTRNKG